MRSRTLEDLAVQSRVLEREAAVGADHAERLAVDCRSEPKTERALAGAERTIGKGARSRHSHSRHPRRNSKSGEPRLQDRPAGDETALRPALDPAAGRARIGQPERRAGSAPGGDAADAASAWIRRSWRRSSPAGRASRSGKMLKDEIETVLSLERHLGSRVIGQDHALEQHQPAHPHLARGARRSWQAGRRVPAGGSERRRARPKRRWRCRTSSTAASAT